MTEDGWILWAWSDGKPYPLKLDDYIHVQFRNGRDDSDTEPWTVKDWHDMKGFEPLNSEFDIVAYMKADPR